jgi:hypothetical protein
MVGGNESAVRPRRQKWTLAGADIGRQRAARVESAARGDIRRARQLAAQYSPPLRTLRDRVSFRHRRHQSARVWVFGSGEEDVFVDAKRRRVYISCGEGTVAIVEPRGDGYAELGRVRIISGARTALFVPELDRFYVAVRASGSEPAALWVMRPAEP